MTKKKFAKVAINKDFKTFEVYVVALKALLVSTEMTIHFSHAVLIINKDFVHIAALQQNKASIKILTKYLDFTAIFLFELTMELLENTGIKKHGIELEKDNQPLYGLIYSL